MKIWFLAGFLCLLSWSTAIGQAPATMPASPQSQPALASSAPAQAESPSLPLAQPLVLRDNNVPPLTLQKDESGANLWRLLSSMIIVAVLAVAALVVVKKFLPRLQPALGRGKNVVVLETTYLGPKKSLHLVQVGGQRLLIANSPTGISNLADVTAAFTVEATGEGK